MAIFNQEHVSKLVSLVQYKLNRVIYKSCNLSTRAAQELLNAKSLSCDRLNSSIIYSIKIQKWDYMQRMSKIHLDRFDLGLHAVYIINSFIWNKSKYDSIMAIFCIAQISTSLSLNLQVRSTTYVNVRSFLNHLQILIKHQVLDKAKGCLSCHLGRNYAWLLGHRTISSHSRVETSQIDQNETRLC